MANPAVGLSFTLNSTSVLEEAGGEKEGRWMPKRGGNRSPLQIEARELLADNIPRTGSTLKAPIKSVKAKAIESETETKTSSLLGLRPHDRHQPITSPTSSKEVGVDERTAQGDLLLHCLN